MTFFSPEPVSVLLQPITDGDRMGLAIAKRNIQPMLGGWSLIGGFAERNGENAEQAAIREFRQETGHQHTVDPKYLGSRQTPGGQMLLFFLSPVVHFMEQYEKYVLCPENSEFGIMWDYHDLCFPTHSEFAAMWFATTPRTLRDYLHNV